MPTAAKFTAFQNSRPTAAAPLLPASLPNPFHSSIVEDAWSETQADVPTIQQHVFETCCKAVDAVRATQQSAGILIQGEAGSGKTHLLARLHAFLQGEMANTELEHQRQVFVSVRLTTHPSRIWRWVRQCLVDDLLKRMPDGLTQLEHLLAMRLAPRIGGEGDLSMWWDYIRDAREEDLEDALDELAEEIQLDSSLTTVLEHVTRRRCRRQARAWLRGESLSNEDLKKLNLPQVQENEQEQPEDQARSVVLGLCRLGGPQFPLIFCFDQVEGLQVSLGDKSGLRSFGNLVCDLHDAARNTVLISCVQSQYLSHARESIGQYAYARLTSFANRPLYPLTYDEAVALVIARLNASPDLAAFRKSHSDPLWPLTPHDIHLVVEMSGKKGLGCTPRELISHCAARFAEYQGQVVTTPRVDQLLPNVWEERIESSLSANQPNDSGNILIDALPLLIEVAAPGWKVEDRVGKSDLDFVLVHPQQEGRVGVSICDQENMRSLGARLKRLKAEVAKEDLHKLVLIRDGRTPITSTAKQAQELLKEFEQNDAVIYRPLQETLAALDTLRKLISDAESGDLSVAGQTVETATVRDWLAANLVEPLARCRDKLISYPGLGAVDFEPLEAEESLPELDRVMELLNEQNLIAVDEMALTLGLPPGKVLAVCHAEASAIGLISGNPQVMFRRIGSGVAGV